VIEHRDRLLRATGWLALLLASFAAAAAPRIGLVTMDPGETYWERFGHNAILVAPEDGSEPLLYNYGYFDFDEPGFLLRFARGDMRYRLVEIPLADDLAYYRDVGRGVDLLWLDVAPDKAQRLAEFLQWNARPENAGYRYDYFTDNCATRVRDALDDALDGALQRQLSGRSHGLTYRDEAMRLGAPVAWMALGMHIGMGPFGDRPLSLWQEAFVPMRLREDLREVLTAERHPVIVAEQTLNVARLPPEPQLFAGMFGRVEIPAGREPRLRVPASAIERIGQLEFVDALGPDGAIERRLVTTGDVDGSGRAEVLSGLAAVDHVILFAEDTPRDLVARLRPDVLAKGADWPLEDIVGRAEVEAAGGRVERIAVVPGVSTSALLARIRGT